MYSPDLGILGRSAGEFGGRDTPLREVRCWPPSCLMICLHHLRRRELGEIQRWVAWEVSCQGSCRLWESLTLGCERGEVWWRELGEVERLHIAGA